MAACRVGHLLAHISPSRRESLQITGHHDGFYRYLALSPDGTLLVYAAMEEKKLGLWIMPAEGGKSLPITVTRRDHIYIMDVDIEKVKAKLKLPNQ